MTALDTRRRTPSPLQMQAQHREANAPGRGITIVAGVWALIVGLVLAVTAGHGSVGHLAAVGLTAVGASVLARLIYLAGRAS